MPNRRLVLPSPLQKAAQELSERKIAIAQAKGKQTRRELSRADKRP